MIPRYAPRGEPPTPTPTNDHPPRQSDAPRGSHPRQNVPSRPSPPRPHPRHPRQNVLPRSYPLPPHHPQTERSTSLAPASTPPPPDRTFRLAHGPPQPRQTERSISRTAHFPQKLPPRPPARPPPIPRAGDPPSRDLAGFTTEKSLLRSQRLTLSEPLARTTAKSAILEDFPPISVVNRPRSAAEGRSHGTSAANRATIKGRGSFSPAIPLRPIRVRSPLRAISPQVRWRPRDKHSGRS